MGIEEAMKPLVLAAPPCPTASDQKTGVVHTFSTHLLAISISVAKCAATVAMSAALPPLAAPRFYKLSSAGSPPLAAMFTLTARSTA